MNQGYVSNLRQVMGGLRQREEGPSVSMMAWDTPLLPPRYDIQLERRKDPAMQGKLKFERRMRNRMRVFIAYEWAEVTSFERVTLHTRYPELPTCFDLYELSADFLSGFPPCLVYYGLCMMGDPQSPQWMVFLSEWSAIFAKRFIWSTDDGRVYLLPTAVVEWLRRLDLTRVLRLAALHKRVLALLDFHDSVDWPRVPYSQGHHYDHHRMRNYSSGRRYDSGTPLSGNWVRIEAGTLNVTHPELLRGRSEPNTGGDDRNARVRRREEVPEDDPDCVAREPVWARAKLGERGLTADVVMADGEVTGAPDAFPAVEAGVPTELSETELRSLLRYPRMASQIRRLVAESSAGEGSLTAPGAASLGREAPLSTEAEGSSDRVLEKEDSNSPVTARGRGVTPGEPREVVLEEEVGDYEEDNLARAMRYCRSRLASPDPELSSDSPSVSEFPRY